MTISKLALAASAAGLSLAAALPADAQTIAALADGDRLVMIDAAKKKVTGWVPVKGAKLAGIDVRPADGKLYGVSTDGNIVTIDTKTGQATVKAKISEPLPAGVQWSVDFNPVADRLRVIGSDGSSYRINVDDGKAAVDGKLKYAEADANKGKTPKAVAIGYSNSFAGTKETALYDIDATTGAFVRQAPPNDGILTTLGQVGVKLNGAVAFDIWADGKGGNTGWLLMGGKLHSVDIATGKTTMVGAISGLKGKVTDLAILP